MWIVSLDKWMVCHAHVGKIPFILGAKSRKGLHLQIHHAFVAAGKSHDERLVKFLILRNLVIGGHPLAVPLAEVDGKIALTIGIEGGRDVDIGGDVVGIPSEGAVEKWLRVEGCRG